MPKPLNLMPYQTGDEAKILELFRLSFGQPMALEFWNWRFRDNPAGHILIELAWDEDILAAHYAVSPHKICVNGSEYLAGLSMTTMTHPQYRGLGLFTTLAERLYARMTQQKYLMVWGFPNDQSHRGFVRDLAWRDLYEIPMFRLDLQVSRAFQFSTCAEIVELHDWDEQVDTLWNQVAESGVRVKRDREYFTWRFCRHPQHHYRLLGYMSNGVLRGYIVFKMFEHDAVDIVDLVALNDPSVGVALIEAVTTQCIQGQRRFVNVWLPVHNPLHWEMEKMGFRNQAPITFMGARFLNLNALDPNRIDMRQWHYAMSDSDVF